MKRRIALVLLCCIVFLAGCTGGQGGNETPTVIPAAADKTAEPPASPTPAPETAAGMVTALTEAGFTIEDSSGETFSFIKARDMEMTIPSDLWEVTDSQMDAGRIFEPGALVEVSYTKDGDQNTARGVTLAQDAPKPAFNLYEGRAAELMKDMTLEEKVGQMFFARCPETDAAEAVAIYHPGGYILFDRDFEGKTRDEVRENIADYQSAAKVGMLIGVDEEGGTVKRVSKYEALCDEPFLSPQELYEQGGMDLIVSDTKKKAEVLEDLGINVNLAPVCDVSTDADNFIYKRAFGKDAEETSKYVTAVVTQMNESGIGCTLKHFPGYGSNADTHTGIADDKRDYDTFVQSDFLPFEAGVEAGAGSILVSHNIVHAMDGENPASLSPKVHEILRKDLGYYGVIMTDDLYMDAIRDEYGTGEAAVLAVQAGNDLLISSQMDEQYPAVLEAAEDGTLARDRIDEAVMKVLCWKLSLGIIE